MKPMTEFVDTAQWMAPSLLTAAALSFTGSITGVFVLLRRESLVALALPQVVCFGVAVATVLPRAGIEAMAGPTWAGLMPLGVALGAVVVAMLLLVWARHWGRGDLLIPPLYVAGMVGAILLIYNHGVHKEEIQNFLSGFDITVIWRDAWIASVPLVLVGLLVAALWRRWLVVAQMPTVGQLASLHPAVWNGGFLMLLAVTILLGTNYLGAALVLVMLFVPAATVLPWARRIPSAMGWAVAMGLFSVAAGCVVAIEQEWPFSQSVGGVASLLLAISWTSRALAELAGATRTAGAGD